MDRAMEGGIDDVGIGVLFGLNMYRYDFVGLLMHAEHLEARLGVGPHTISVPRIRPADDIDPENFSNAVSDEIFAKIVTVLRIAVPYTGMILSTRDQKKTAKVLELGISQISGGSGTASAATKSTKTRRELGAFDVNDRRTMDEVVNWLLSSAKSSFCTACTGWPDRDPSVLVKTGKIATAASERPDDLKEISRTMHPRHTAKGRSCHRRVLDNVGSKKGQRCCGGMA
jgi:2-iminoacetate synthase